MPKPPRDLHLPDTRAMSEAADDGRRFAPSAGRNAAPILDLLMRNAPETGRALEIASGTGQHVCAFAEALPGLEWQPTDLALQNLDSIRAWAAEAALPNLCPPLLMDAAAPGWSGEHGPLDLIVTVNLLHLIGADEMRAIIAEAGRALAPGGLWFLYGPFRRAHGFASDGDAAFHAKLTAQDPAIGYKDVRTVRAALAESGFDPVETVEMPASNLTFLARKAG
ncbi:MAG: DUF938 domain-containing protein [Paracoccaceae bacterium]